MLKKLLIPVLLLAGILVYVINDASTEPAYLHQVKVPREKKYIFPNLKGPEKSDTVAAATQASWRTYHDDNPSALAILLTDTASDWVGLAQGLKTIGVPFIMTTDVNEAIQHKTVLAYPVISGKVLSGQALRLLAAVPRSGGNLIGVNVYGGGLNEVFGFDSVIAATNRHQLQLHGSLANITGEFTHENEKNIRLANEVDYPDALPTNGYTRAQTALISYKNDSTAFLTYRDYGTGKAFAFGLDLGNYFLRYRNERGFGAHRTYANEYEPGMDVMLRILKNIYQSGGNTVTLGTVPFNRALTLILTHDVDYTRSVINAAAFARTERELGVKATYFIQTKYIQDWNDDIFFNQAALGHLQRINELGMEIASHSVSHSRVFSRFPLGTGTESYPRYSPFVQESQVTYNGSILGELRVSKFLLEHTLPNVSVVSFRPGHLQHPFALPQALKATGYAYSSSATANNVQTHLPFIQMYDRGFRAGTDIVEIPITIEDELGLPLLQRLNQAVAVADALSSYGGVMNVLVHTDTLGQKLTFVKQLIEALKERAWVTTIKEMGQWWRIRNAVQLTVSPNGNTFEVNVTNPSGQTIEGLVLQVPASWQLATAGSDCIREKNAVIIKKLQGRKLLVFHKNQLP